MPSPVAILSHAVQKTATQAPSSQHRTGQSRNSSHAIVMGGSIAGLLAARVLLNHFDQVTLLERDQFPETPEIRPGVPQGPHVHGLLLRGQQTLEQLFPGLLAELDQLGAQSLDWIHHWQFLTAWGWLEQHDSGLNGVCCSRLLIEWSVRQRLLRYPKFSLRPGCYVKGLQLDPIDRKRVIGVEFQEKSEQEKSEQEKIKQDKSEQHESAQYGQTSRLQSMQATLVVDATGRQSKLPQYLSHLGYAPPTETLVNSFLGYASRWYKHPPSLSQPVTEQGIIINPDPKQSARGGVLYPVEGDRWVVTLWGIAGDHPPGDEAGFMAFMKSLRTPILYERLKDAEPCSPIYCYRRTENLWKHYEALTLPAGLIALGDAVCCFNPVYGQGMTAAAMGATILDQSLKQHMQGRSSPRLGSIVLSQRFTRRFQKQLAAMLKTPWLMATGEDFRWEKTVGDRPGWASKQLQRYIDRVLQLSQVDAAAHRAFIEVAHLTQSPAILFTPRLMWKTLTQDWRQAKT